MAFPPKSTSFPRSRGKGGASWEPAEVRNSRGTPGDLGKENRPPALRGRPTRPSSFVLWASAEAQLPSPASTPLEGKHFSD